MPVTNSHNDEKMPWTELGRTGMPIKPTGRPCGTLANLAGIAENVGNLSDEERGLRDRPDSLLVMSETPSHVAVSTENASGRSTPLAFRMMERVIGAAGRLGRSARR